MKYQVISRKIRVIWAVPECEMRRWERVMVMILASVIGVTLVSLSIYLGVWR